MTVPQGRRPGKDLTNEPDRIILHSDNDALVACRSMNHKDTIAGLRHKKIEIKEVKIEGGLDKAMASYQRFLAETPDTALTPEAIRRLADLKIENEYGTLTEDRRSAAPAERVMTAPKQAKQPKDHRNWGNRRNTRTNLGISLEKQRVRNGL